MKFTYKNEAELQKMTAEERDAYAVEKRNHEEQKTEEIAKKFADAMKSEISKDAFNEESEEFKTMKAKLEAIDKSIEDLGKNKQPEIMGFNKKVGAIFQEQHKELEAGTLEVDDTTKARGAKMRIETKAFDSLNVHSVGSVAAGTYPTNGTVSAVGADFRTVYAQILGVFNVPRVYSKIMDVVDISPLIADKIMAFTQTITSGFAITPELTEKPVSKIALTSESADANPVSSLFFTSLHMRRFYPTLVNEFVKTFNKLLQEAIPNHVMTVVRANSVAYTDIANLDWVAPEEFEAIVAVTTGLKKLGYMPNMLCLSPVGYAKLITATDNNGTYKVQNGSSIVLVGDQVKIGSYNLTIVEDAEFGDDEFMIGDAKEAVKVGLDSEVFYFETDGRTDNQNAAGLSPSTGLAVNVRTHELAQFVAVLLPAGAKGALIRDTFSNVKTLITTGP